MKKVVAIIMAATLTVTSFAGVDMIQAAKSCIKLNATKKTSVVGKTITLKATVAKNKKEKIGAVKWSASKKGYVTIKTSNKGKTAKITMKKKGNVVVSAKVKIGKKNYIGKCNIKIAAKPMVSKSPTVVPTQTPSIEPTAQVTQTPSAEPTAQVTQTPGTEPTAQVTQTPGTEPTAQVTQTPGTEPTAQVTQTPSAEPTAQATVTPSIEPTVSPVTESKVKWTVTEEKFQGAYSKKNEETGETENFPAELTRKYVSFNPWPTTQAQVQYVIKNCDDPYVIGALYVVALDNYEYKGLSDYSSVTYAMLNDLMNGAGALSGEAYQLSIPQKQKLRDYGMKKILTTDGTAVTVSSFASRAYLKGATPYNNYTPEGGLQDKTKWKIVMDEYVYCGDINNGYITVCPQRYTESQETAGGEKIPVEHWQGIRIGFQWNKTAKVWIPTDNVSLNTPPTGALVPFDISKQIMFSNNYVAPVADQGW